MGFKPLAILLLLSLIQQGGVLAQCSTTAVGTVVLNDCPMHVHDFAQNSSLVIEYVDLVQALPTTTMTTKVFRMEGQPARIPLGVLRMPKGVNASILLRNMASGSTPTNLHTHGLHVHGTQNFDGTTGDDVSVEVESGTERQYRYFLPGDHAGGVHWIHAHVHMRTEIQVLGGAYGMIIVEDDPNGYEVPLEIVQAESHELIFAHFNAGRFNNALNRAGFSLSPNINTQPYMTNGFTNPILKIKQGKWTRLRTLHASPSSPLYMRYPSGTHGCTLVLLAKDGVYLPKGPRTLNTNTDLFYTQASRVDLMIKCDGPVGTKVQFRTNNAAVPAPPPPGPAPPVAPDVDVFQVEIQANTGGSPDAWFPNFSACAPDYTFDTTSLSAGQVKPRFTLELRGPAPPPGTGGNTLNGNQFRSFGAGDSIRNMTAGTVEEFMIDGVNHPYHLHVYPMQYQTTAQNGWHQVGDWVDVVMGQAPPFPIVRLRVDQHLGPVVMHCHITGHEDGGLMGIGWTNNDPNNPPSLGVRPEEFWGQAGNQCNTPVPLRAGSPTASPTSGAISSSLNALLSALIFVSSVVFLA